MGGSKGKEGYGVCVKVTYPKALTTDSTGTSLQIVFNQI